MDQQNYRKWVCENLHDIYEKPMHFKNALFGVHYGQNFFGDNVVNSYQKILKEFFNETNNFNLDHICSQQVGMLWKEFLKAVYKSFWMKTYEAIIKIFTQVFSL